MKTLSVAFYKKLILTLLALLILIPTVCAVVFGVQNSILRRELGKGGSAPGQVQGTRPGGAVDLEAAPIGYQELYPELYSAGKIAAERLYEENTVYLTFNSTPGDNTGDILDALDDCGVKGTFFLSGTVDTVDREQMKAIVDRGHSIGLNGYSDSYQQVYRSVEAFLDDFKAIYDLVYEITGVRAEIFRYPGGSINVYNSGFYQELNAEMLRRGFVFFDWDVTGGDTQIGGVSAEQIEDQVLTGMEGKDRGIVLLRDTVGKESVPAALPGIVAGLQDRGYQFLPLTANVIPVVYSYKDAP